MASNADHFIRALTAPPTRLSGAINSASVNIGLESLEGIQSDTAVVMTIDRVDADGKLTPELTEVVLGTLGNNGLENVVRGVGGKKQAHKSGAVVEVSVASSEQWNRLVTALLKTHNQDGTLKEIDGSKIKDSSLDGSKIKPSSVKPEHFDKLVWHNVSYENGFSALDSGGYQVPQYSKDAFGIVRLRGIAKHSQSNVTERIIFRLPVGFRPAGAEIFATPNASSVGRVNINPDGGVTLAALHNPSSSYVSLSGISFQAA